MSAPLLDNEKPRQSGEWWNVEGTRRSTFFYYVALLFVLAACLIARYVRGDVWPGIGAGVLAAFGVAIAYFVGAHDAGRRL